MSTLMSIIPTNWLIDGAFFQVLKDNNKPLPWDDDTNISNKSLDIDILTSYGKRVISPLLDVIIGEELMLTTEQMLQISLIIYQRYILNWTKLYDTLKFEYNAIENYNMVEDTTDTHDNTLTHTNDAHENKKHTEKETVENKSDASADGNIYGFNSSSPVGTNQQLTGAIGNETRNNEITDENTNGYNITDTDKGGSTHKIKRTGNIGVTTTQQMIEAERKMWQFDYFERIYRDMRDILTIPYYEN